MTAKPSRATALSSTTRIVFLPCSGLVMRGPRERSATTTAGFYRHPPAGPCARLPSSSCRLPRLKRLRAAPVGLSSSCGTAATHAPPDLCAQFLGVEGPTEDALAIVLLR